MHKHSDAWPNANEASTSDNSHRSVRQPNASTHTSHIVCCCRKLHWPHQRLECAHIIAVQLVVSYRHSARTNALLARDVDFACYECGTRRGIFSEQFSHSICIERCVLNIPRFIPYYFPSYMITETKHFFTTMDASRAADMQAAKNFRLPAPNIIYNFIRAPTCIEHRLCLWPWAIKCTAATRIFHRPPVQWNRFCGLRKFYLNVCLCVQVQVCNGTAQTQA